MNRFHYARADDVAAAVRLHGGASALYGLATLIVAVLWVREERRAGR